MAQPSADFATLLLTPTAEDPAERPTRALEALLAPHVDATAIAALEAAVGGLPYFSLMREIFRLGEADFVVRLAVLAEIAESDRARWEPDVLQRHFAWLAPEALAAILRAVRRAGWLELEGRALRLSDRGEALFPLVRRIVDIRPALGDLALGVLSVELSRELGAESTPALRHLRHNLCRIVEEAEIAIESHSEVRILECRERIDRNLGWAKRARQVVETMDLSETEAYRIAQGVGQQLSELHRWHATLHRALGDLSDKRVALGSSGLSIVDMTQFLMRCDIDQLADFGASLVATPVQPLFGIADNLIHEAAYELGLDRGLGGPASRYGWSDGAPQQADQGEPELPGVTALDRFAVELGDRLAQAPRAALAAVVPGRSWADSAYRLSLLALAEGVAEESAASVDRQGGDPALAALTQALRFAVTIEAPGDAAVAIATPFVGAVSAGEVQRLAPTSEAGASPAAAARRGRAPATTATGRDTP